MNIDIPERGSHSWQSMGRGEKRSHQMKSLKPFSGIGGFITVEAARVVQYYQAPVVRLPPFLSPLFHPAINIQDLERASNNNIGSRNGRTAS